jgi:hypothetical protein
MNNIALRRRKSSAIGARIFSILEVCRKPDPITYHIGAQCDFCGKWHGVRWRKSIDGSAPSRICQECDAMQAIGKSDG